MLRHRAKDFVKSVSRFLGACFVNMWHLALHWDGLMGGCMEKELGLDWIVHAKVTARRLVDFQALYPELR
jgi:hypothetical protein